MSIDEVLLFFRPCHEGAADCRPDRFLLSVSSCTSSLSHPHASSLLQPLFFSIEIKKRCPESHSFCTCCTHIFSAHGACTVTSAHLHACAHTRMARVHEKKKRCLLHMYHSSPSRLLQSHVSPVFAVSVRLSLSTFPSTSSCRTCLSQKRRACGDAHEDEKFGSLAKSALNTPRQPGGRPKG